MDFLPLVTCHKLAENNSYVTDDLDDARNYIGQTFKPHELHVLGTNQALDVCIGRASLGPISLIYHRHGAHVSVKPEKLDDFFLLQVPIFGEAKYLIDNQEIFCGIHEGVMISPSSGIDMEFRPGCEQLILKVDRSNIENHLEQQLQRPLGAPLKFSPLIKLHDINGQQILQLLEYFLSSLSINNGKTLSPIVQKNMISLLFSSLLSSLEHNYTRELLTGISSPNPFYIKKAQQFIEENITAPITPEIIANAVSVSPRTLYSGFKRYLEITPMKYINEVRLDKVHKILSEMDPKQASISSIAMDYGFQHLSHFSSIYKRKFCQSPKETLYKNY